MNNNIKTPEDIMKKAVEAAEDRKALDIDVLDIHELTTIADYFVICSGNSAPQIKAIADSVEAAMSKEGIPPLHMEGYQAASWILIDYGSVVIHVFLKEAREFYSIERLWRDAKKLDIASAQPEK